MIANIFQPLIDVFESVMVFVHDTFGFGWGVSIIALTVAVRALLVPLAIKQAHSMQAMQRLQPEIKRLQARYKGDKQRLNQEMMKFYQENKVNPFASCLPLVAQMPVFLSLYYMLRKDLKLDICPGIEQYADRVHQSLGNLSCGDYAAATHQTFNTGFLFIPDLTSRATGAVLITLLVLYVGTQLVSSLVMMTTIDKNQQRMMMVLPLLFVVFIQSFPAGLLLYWITTNIWTIVQGFIIRRVVIRGQPPLEVATAGAAAAAEPSKGLWDRLREAVEPPTAERRPAKQAAAKKGADDEQAAPESDKQSGKRAKAGRSGSRGSSSQPARRSGPPPSAPRKKSRKRSGRRR